MFCPVMGLRASLHVPVRGWTYDAMVVAMNQRLDGLSRDIAVAIQRPASRAAARDEAAAQ